MINNSSNISFQSRINFVSPQAYAKVKKANLSDFFMTNEVRKIIDNGHTQCIRTCTGGFCTNKEGEVKGFHIFHEQEDSQLARYITNLKKGIIDKGLIIGGKNLPDCPQSLVIFDAIKETFMSKCKNISFFKQFIFPISEVSVHYSKDLDTYTILGTIGNNGDYVKSLKGLRNLFEEIFIAPGDQLSIGGKIVCSNKINSTIY